MTNSITGIDAAVEEVREIIEGFADDLKPGHDHWVDVRYPHNTNHYIVFWVDWLVNVDNRREYWTANNLIRDSDYLSLPLEERKALLGRRFERAISEPKKTFLTDTNPEVSLKD